MFGQVFPEMVANVRFEGSHRYIAATVGILTIILNLWLWLSRSSAWVRRLGLAALVAVVAQGVLGGVRVLFPEHRFVLSVIHACLAQFFFCLTVALALLTAPAPIVPYRFNHSFDQERTGASLRRACAAAIVAIFVQLALGAAFRHQGIGITAHVVGAVVVTVLVAWAVRLVFRSYRTEKYLIRPAIAAAAILVVQLILGVAAYLARVASRHDPQPLEPMISLTVAHVAFGALVLAAMVVLTLRAFHSLSYADSAIGDLPPAAQKVMS